MMERETQIQNQNHVFSHVKIELSATELSELNSFVSKNAMTLNILTAGAWAVLLSRYCNSTDVLFGATLTVRPSAINVDDVVGPFINTVPVRVRLADSDTCISVLEKLRTQQVSNMIT